MSVSGLNGSKFWGKNFFDTSQAGVVESVKASKHDMIRYVVPPEEVKRWLKLAGEPIWDEWVRKMESKGRPEAREILKATLEMLRN
jgi:hypothetical protein